MHGQPDANEEWWGLSPPDERAIRPTIGKKRKLKYRKKTGKTRKNYGIIKKERGKETDREERREEHWQPAAEQARNTENPKRNTNARTDTDRHGNNSRGKVDGKTAPNPTPEPTNQSQKHPYPFLSPLSPFLLVSVAPKSKIKASERSGDAFIFSGAERTEKNRP